MYATNRETTVAIEPSYQTRSRRDLVEVEQSSNGNEDQSQGRLVALAIVGVARGGGGGRLGRGSAGRGS